MSRKAVPDGQRRKAAASVDEAALIQQRCLRARELLAGVRGRQPPGGFSDPTSRQFERACKFLEEQLANIEKIPVSGAATDAALEAERAAVRLDAVISVPEAWAGEEAIARAIEIIGSIQGIFRSWLERSSKGKRNGGRREEPTFTAEQEKRIVTIYEQRARDGELYGAMKHLRSTFDTTDPTLRRVLKKHGVKSAKYLKGG